MRDETRKKLDSHMSAERWAAVMLGGLIVVCGILWELALITPSGPISNVVGKVTSVRVSIHPDVPRMIVNFDADLDDGRRILASSTSAIAPKVGERVVLREITDWVGFHRFRWDGLVPQPPTSTP